VRPALGPPLSHVELHGAEGVDGESLVRVDGNTEESGVGVDQLGLVTNHRVPENAGIAKESKVGHVLRHVKLWRVDLTNGVRFVGFHLPVDVHVDFLANCLPIGHLHVILGETLEVATSSFVGDPTAFLAIVRLFLVLHLHLWGDLQPWGGIRVGSS